MAENSIAAELLLQINLSKLRPTPNYLSPSDAMTVEEFEQLEYGSDYSLDVSNVDWGMPQMTVMFLTSSANTQLIMTALRHV